MPTEHTQRRLAAIMFADIVGYTALMAQSEERALAARERHRAVVRPLVERHGGQWIEEIGDESLSCFPSALDAVRCGLAIQDALGTDAELQLRIGIHLGDVVFEGERVYGDGVNVASRIRPLADPGGICVSDEVEHSIRNQADIEAIPLGEHHLKHVGRPVPVFAVGAPGQVVAPSHREPAQARAKRPVWYVAATVGAALLLAGVAAWLQNRPAAEPAPIRSLAVLPFDNLMNDPAQDYFADGMTEALIAELAKVGSLQVISRTSVLQYRDSTKTAPEIARELGVEGLIEGSVLRDGDQVRITAQLVHAPSDRHLWAESYTNTLTNVLRLHSDVALAIVDAVGATLTPEESGLLAERGSVDPEAYEAFLLGIQLSDVTNEEGLRTALRHFRRATELDPDFALAWARLSIAHTFLCGFGIEEPSVGYPLARSAALRALELDPRLAPSHWALAFVSQAYDWEWRESERRYRRAIALAPSDPDAHSWLAWLLLHIGRDREALEEAELALKLDPRSRWTRRNLAVVLSDTRSDSARARRLLSEIVAEDPAFIPALDSQVWRYLDNGEYERAAAAVATWTALTPGEPFPRLHGALVQAHAGRHEMAREIVAASRRDFGDEELPSGLLARIHVALGEMDEAFAAFDRSLEEREWFAVWLKVMPYAGSNVADAAWVRFRRDPRYWQLVRRMNFPPFPPEHPGYAEEQAYEKRAAQQATP